MAKPEYTQIRTKFQYRFLALKRAKLNATPRHQSVITNSEQAVWCRVAISLLLLLGLPASGRCSMNKLPMLTCLHSTDPCGLIDVTPTIYANQPLLKMERVKIVSMILSLMRKIWMIAPHFFIHFNDSPTLTELQVITQVSVANGDTILLGGLVEPKPTQPDTG